MEVIRCVDNDVYYKIFFAHMAVLSKIIEYLIKNTSINNPQLKGKTKLYVILYNSGILLF